MQCWALRVVGEDKIVSNVSLDLLLDLLAKLDIIYLNHFYHGRECRLNATFFANLLGD